MPLSFSTVLIIIIETAQKEDVMATVTQHFWLRSLFILGAVSILTLVLSYGGLSSKPFLRTVWHPAASAKAPSKTSSQKCAKLDFTLLQTQLKGQRFAEELVYYRQYVRPVRLLTELPSIKAVHEELLPADAAVIINSSSATWDSIELPCLRTIELPVTASPPSGQADLTPFIFGVSTSLPRLRKSTPAFLRWLTQPSSVGVRKSNGATLLVLLHNTTAAERIEAGRELQAWGIEAVVEPATEGYEMPERYLELIPRMHNYIRMSTEVRKDWMVLIDDDTFFTRPHALATALADSHKWNTSERLYVGCMTEIRKERTDDYTMLLGGAGVFLSIPIAEAMLSPAITTSLSPTAPEILNELANSSLTTDINNHPTIYDLCRHEDATEHGGDARLTKCIYRHLHTPVAEGSNADSVSAQGLEGLHQEDIFGDPSGFYESGAPMLSIHHWKSWHWFDPVALSRVGDVAGEDGVLQRWRFPGASAVQPGNSPRSALAANSRVLRGDTAWRTAALREELDSEASYPIILTNGYSLAQYPAGITFDTDMAEATMDPYLGYGLEEMEYGVGRGWREKVVGKRSWGLLGAEEVVGGDEVGEERVRQWYGFRGVDGRVERVLEVVWLVGRDG